MFSSLFDAARSSPFKGPLTVARCDAAGGAPAGTDSCEFGSTKYFLLCGLGGIISCGKWNLRCSALFESKVLRLCNLTQEVFFSSEVSVV